MGRSSQQTMAMKGQAGPRISIARFLAFTQNQGGLLLYLLKNKRIVVRSGGAAAPPTSLERVVESESALSW